MDAAKRAEIADVAADGSMESLVLSRLGFAGAAPETALATAAGNACDDTADAAADGAARSFTSMQSEPAEAEAEAAGEDAIAASCAAESPGVGTPN